MAIPESLRKKYSVLMVILFIAGIAGMVLVIAGSGLLAEGNPDLSRQVVERINLERQANSIAAVQVDDALAASALEASRKIRAASLTGPSAATSVPGDETNIIVIPKLSWAVSGYDAREQIFDMLENKDPSFRNNILASDYRDVGVGITSDALNYFIAIQWR
jgi:hypothetical protein